MAKQINTRIQHKHDIEANWRKAVNFVPMQGELIVYDRELDLYGNTLALPADRTEPYSYERVKMGDGVTAINDLAFIDDTITVTSTNIVHEGTSLTNILNTNLLNVNYSDLAFDTSELITELNSSVDYDAQVAFDTNEIVIQ